MALSTSLLFDAAVARGSGLRAVRRRSFVASHTARIDDERLSSGATASCSGRHGGNVCAQPARRGPVTARAARTPPPALHLPHGMGPGPPCRSARAPRRPPLRPMAAASDGGSITPPTHASPDTTRRQRVRKMRAQQHTTLAERTPEPASAQPASRSQQDQERAGAGSHEPSPLGMPLAAADGRAAFSGLLIGRIKCAETWREVRQHIEGAPDPDAVELCTSLHRVQDILGTGVRAIEGQEDADLRAFVRRVLHRLLDVVGALPPPKRSHTMANTLLSLARLHHRPSSAMMRALCSWSVPVVAHNSKQATANMLLALALLGATPEEEDGLVAALIEIAVEQLPRFALKETSQVLWAIAKLDVPPSSTVQRLFQRALRYWPDQIKAPPPDPRRAPTPKNLAQIAFAYAKAHSAGTPTSYLSSPTPNNSPAINDTYLAFMLIFPDVLDALPSMAPQGLALLLWAYAKLGADQTVMCKLAWAAYPAICTKLGRFNAQGLVMLVYALALSCLRHEPLLDVLTAQCRARMRSFSATDCGVLLWSTGRLRYEDEDLVAAVVQQYTAATQDSPPPISVVSQMLKGAVTQRCLSLQLLQLLDSHAEAVLNDRAAFPAFVRYVVENYDVTSAQQKVVLKYHHIRHMARLSMTEQQQMGAGAAFAAHDAPQQRGSARHSAQRGHDDAELQESASRSANGNGRSACAAEGGVMPIGSGSGNGNGSRNVAFAPRGAGVQSLPSDTPPALRASREIATDGGGSAGASGVEKGGGEMEGLGERAFLQGALRRSEAMQESPLFRLVCSTLRALRVTFTEQPMTVDGVLVDVLCEVRGRRVALQLLFVAQMVAVVPRDQVCCTPYPTPVYRERTHSKSIPKYAPPAACDAARTLPQPPSRPAAWCAFERDGTTELYYRLLSARLETVPVREYEFSALRAADRVEWLANQLGITLSGSAPASGDAPENVSLIDEACEAQAVPSHS